MEISHNCMEGIKKNATLLQFTRVTQQEAFILSLNSVYAGLTATISTKKAAFPVICYLTFYDGHQQCVIVHNYWIVKGLNYVRL